MPPNGVEEWRARIGNWENRKLRWYQACSGSRRVVPLRLERVILEAPQLCLLLLLLLAEKVATCMCEGGKDALSALGRLASRVRCCACRRSLRARATPLFSLVLAVSLLLIVAGDVETNPGPINDEFLARVDNSELTDRDIHEVYDAVHTLCARWSDLCFALKLLPAEEEAIAETYRGKPRRCLREVLLKWLRKSYDHSRYGCPSWRFLVQAVGDPSGGSDCALAETIGKSHTAVPVAVPQRKDEGPSKPRPDPRQTNKLCSDFAEMFAGVTNILDKSVDMGNLVDFLYYYGHPLYPEQHYIDPRVYRGATTTKEVIKSLFPQYINYMSSFLLEDIVEKLGCDRAKKVLQQYTEQKCNRKRKLCDQPAPITDEEVEQFYGTKKLKVQVEGDSGEATVEVIGEIQKVLEKATGISRAVITYAFNDPGSVLLTFLIPESISHIFNELNSEDLAILAKLGVKRLEIDELAIGNIQKYSTVTVGATELKIAAGMSESTKATGLGHYLQERASEMTPERCSFLNNIDCRKHYEICSDVFLKDFANDLQDWIALSPYFGIHEWLIEEVVRCYPDENEQKYVALLHWKREEKSAATYYNLLESLILHGTIGEVEALLLRLGEGPMVLSTSHWLKQQYLDHDCWQQWREVPNLMQFDQRLGELESSTSKELREMDYSTSYFDMTEDPLEITSVSVKSLNNEITHLASGCFLIKGAPAQGKSFLLSKLCQYWALGYGMRRFTLMFWVDCLSFQNAKIGLLELLSQLLRSGSQNVSSLCRWIKNRLGQDVIFILDGYNYQHKLPGDIFQKLTSQELLPKSVILITSTCTPFHYNIKQYELLMLTDTQVFKQVLRFFSGSPSRAEDFLLYLTIHPDMKVLASSPTHLYTLLLVYNDVVDSSSSKPPVTWTEMFTNTTLFLLRSTFPSVLQTGKKYKYFSNLPSNVQSFLYHLSASAFEDLSSAHPHRLSLSRRIKALLGHKIALVHRCSTPLASKEKQYFQFFSKLLQQFLAAVHIAKLPPSKQTKLMVPMKELNFMWQFYAGLIPFEPYETFQILKERYCKGSIKALANCAYEANWVCDMPSIIKGHILTAADIHHLKIASDMIFRDCCIAKGAILQLSRQAHAHALNGDRGSEMSFVRCILPNNELGSLAASHTLSLRLCHVNSTGAIALGEALKKSKSLEVLDLGENRIANDGATSLGDALRVNHCLKTLDLGDNGISDDGATSLGDALRVNHCLKTLDLEYNEIGDDGATSLGDALRVNHSLETLNLGGNGGIGVDGATSLGDALRVNHSLKALDLRGNEVGDDGAISLGDALRVNHSLKMLQLESNGIDDDGATSLGNALRVNRSLKTLHLGGNDIDDDGATSLGDALRVNHSLKKLGLYVNGISREKKQKLTQQFGTRISV